jgi:hypothetical protein
VPELRRPCRVSEKKLTTDNIINSLALFGIFAGWFYFPSAVVAPVTIGWGWLIASLFAIAFVERSIAITALACALALFSRETTMIFALVMFLSLLVWERDRDRRVVASILVLVTSCLLYFALRLGFTSGYEHQIDPAHIFAQLASLNFPAHFFVQLILAQGMPVVLLIFITAKQPRCAAYLLLSALVVSVVALATDVTDVGLVLGEMLPFYATIFILAWNDAVGTRKSSVPTRGNDWLET